jgi:chromosome segregation ATPase
MTDEAAVKAKKWIMCREEFLAEGCERGICQLQKGHKGSHDNTVIEPEDEAAPRTAHEWLEDALGRYQVTHIHASIREALKAMNKTEVDTSELPATVQPEDETTLPAMDGLLKKILDKSPEDEFAQGDMNVGRELFWALVGERKVYKEKHRDALIRLCRRYATSNRELKMVLDRESATTARFDAKVAELETDKANWKQMSKEFQERCHELRDDLVLEKKVHAACDEQHSAERDALKAQLTSAQTLYNMCSAKRLEYKTELSTLKAQLDAVVGQETPERAWGRATVTTYALLRERGLNLTFYMPPYTPPLKAGTK